MQMSNSFSRLCPRWASTSASATSSSRRERRPKRPVSEPSASRQMCAGNRNPSGIAVGHRLAYQSKDQLVSSERCRLSLDVYPDDRSVVVHFPGHVREFKGDQVIQDLLLPDFAAPV